MKLKNIAAIFYSILPKIPHINEEWEAEAPGRQKVVRVSNVPILTPHECLNSRSKYASSLDGSQRLVMTNASSSNHSALRLRLPHFVLVTSRNGELSISNI